MTSGKSDLIAKLEAAEEGSRELSDETLIVFGWAFDEDENSWIPPEGGWWGTDEPGPDVTRSLDAVMTLAPEGCARRTMFCPMGSWPYRVWVYTGATVPLEGDSGSPVLGKTEPLAYCTAFLKARDHEQTR